MAKRRRPKSSSHNAYTVKNPDLVARGCRGFKLRPRSLLDHLAVLLTTISDFKSVQRRETAGVVLCVLADLANKGRKLCAKVVSHVLLIKRVTKNGEGNREIEKGFSAYYVSSPHCDEG